MDFRDFILIWLTYGLIQGLFLFWGYRRDRAEVVTFAILIILGPIFWPAAAIFTLIEWIMSGKLVSRLNGYFMSRTLKNKYPHLTSRERADLQAVIATDIDQRVDEIVMWRNRA